MKLKILRSHYRVKNGTKSWVPKKAFSSVEDAISKGYFPNAWTTYRCDICSNYHVATMGKNK